MGKKKKRIFNKKTDARFHVVQRTQGGNHTEDGGVEGSKYVLQPASYDAVVPEDFPVDLLQLPPEAMDFPGGFDDDFDEDEEYDYSKHMRTMGDGGTYYQNPNAAVLDVRNQEAKPEEDFEDDEDEAERLFDEIVKPSKKKTVKVTKDFLDAMDEEGEFEEIADDFVLTAMQGDDLSDENEDTDGDYEDEGDEGDYYTDEGDEYYEDEEVDEEGRQMRQLDHQFDRLLEEYDDFDDIGELDPEDPRVQGVVEDIEEFRDVIDQFDNRLEHNYGAAKAEVLPEDLNKATKIMAEKQAAEPEEDTVEAIKKMFPETVRDNWDCESIVSTYTNTENHPNMIRVPRKDPKKIIKISKKHGIPVDYFPGKSKTILEEEEEEEEYEEVVDKGERRNKKETKEEKKARKEAVKLAKRQARERKRMLKGQYESEYRRQVDDAHRQNVHNAAHLKL